MKKRKKMSLNFKKIVGALLGVVFLTQLTGLILFAETTNEAPYAAEDTEAGETPVAHLEERLVELESLRRTLNAEINELDRNSVDFEEALAELAVIDAEIAEIREEMSHMWAAYNGAAAFEGEDNLEADEYGGDNDGDDVADLAYAPYEPFEPVYEAPPRRMSDTEINAHAMVPLNDEVVLINTNDRFALFLNRPAGDPEFGPDADGRHFVLTANVTAPTGRIQGRPGVFTGIFDGRNPTNDAIHTISGLRLGFQGTTANAQIAANGMSPGIGFVQQAGDGAIIRNVNFQNNGTANNTRLVHFGIAGTDTGAGGAGHLAAANRAVGGIVGATTSSGGGNAVISIHNVNLIGNHQMTMHAPGNATNASFGGMVGLVGNNTTLNLTDVNNTPLNLTNTIVGNVQIHTSMANSQIESAGGVVGSVRGGTVNVTATTGVNLIDLDMRGESRGTTAGSGAADGNGTNSGIRRGGGVVGYVFSGHVAIYDTMVTTRRVPIAAGLTGGNAVRNGAMLDPLRALGSAGGMVGGLNTTGTVRLNNVENQALIQVQWAGGDGRTQSGVPAGRIGGLIGHVGGTVHITDSRNYGVLQHQGNNAMAGGLIGYTGSSSIVVISDSHNGAAAARPGQILPSGVNAALPGQIFHRNSNGTNPSAALGLGTGSHNIHTFANLGGIVGRSRGRLTIEDTVNNANISKLNINNNASNRRNTGIGGIVGRGAPVGGQAFTMTNVENTGNITLGGHRRVGFVGGIIGEVMTAPRGSGIVNFTDVTNRGTIHGGHQIGGIIGRLRPAGVNIRNATNRGNIVATGGTGRPNAAAGIVAHAGGARLTINTAVNHGNITTGGNEPHSSAGIVGRGTGRWLTMNDVHNYAPVVGHHNAAGIVALSSARNTTIDYGLNHNQVRTTRATSRSIAGGIVAHSHGRDLLIRNTGNFGNVSIASSSNTRTSNMDGAGGILGRSRSANARVEISFNQGTINGRVTAGGIVGRNQGTLQITDVYNIGAVTGHTNGNANGILGRRRSGAVRITRAYVSARVNGYAVATSQSNARTIRMTGRTPAATTGITFSGVFVDGTTFQSLFAGAANAPITQINRNGINVVDTELMTSGFLPGFSSGPWRIGIADVDQEYLRTYPYFDWQIPGEAEQQEAFFSYIRSYQEGRDRIPPEELDLLLEDEDPDEAPTEAEDSTTPDEPNTELIDAEALIELLESEALIEPMESDAYLETMELLELLESAELIEILEAEELADLIEVAQLVELLEAVELLESTDLDELMASNDSIEALEVSELLELLEEVELIVLVAEIDEQEESNEVSDLSEESSEGDSSDEADSELDEPELSDETDEEGDEEIDPMSDWILRYRWRPVMDMNLPAGNHEIRFNFDCEALYENFSVSIPCTFDGAQPDTRIFNTYYNTPNATNNTAPLTGSLANFAFAPVTAGVTDHSMNMTREGMTSIGLVSTNGVVGFETREVIGRLIIRGYDEADEANDGVRNYIDHTHFLIISDDWPTVSLNEAFMNCLDESWPCPPDQQVDTMRGMGLIQIDTAEDDPGEIVNDSLHPKEGEYEPANQRSNEQTVLNDLSDYTIVRITALGYAPAYRIIRTGDLNELSSGAISVPMERVPFQMRVWVPQEYDGEVEEPFIPENSEAEVPPEGPPGANTRPAEDPMGTRAGFGILPWTDYGPDQPADLRNLQPGSNLAIEPSVNIQNNNGAANTSLSYANEDTIENNQAGVAGHFDVRSVMWGDDISGTAYRHSTTTATNLRYGDLMSRNGLGGIDVGYFDTTAIGRGGVTEVVPEPILDLDLYVENLGLPLMHFRFIEIIGWDEGTEEAGAGDLRFRILNIDGTGTDMPNIQLDIMENLEYDYDQTRFNAASPVNFPVYANNAGGNATWVNQIPALANMTSAAMPAGSQTMTGTTNFNTMTPHIRVEGLTQATTFNVTDTTETFVPLTNLPDGMDVADFFEWFEPLVNSIYHETETPNNAQQQQNARYGQIFSFFNTNTDGAGNTARNNELNAALDNEERGEPQLVHTIVVPLVRRHDVEIRVVERISPGVYVDIPHSTLHHNDAQVTAHAPGRFIITDNAGFNALDAAAPDVPGFHPRQVNIGGPEDWELTPEGYIRIVLDPIFHDVDFDLMGGEDEAEFPTQSIRDGSHATRPEEVPTRTGSAHDYEFDGWWTDPEEGELFDFVNTPILEDTTLYARWTPLHRVNFNLLGGEDQTDFPDQIIRHLAHAERPASQPTREGYRFIGWYDAESGGEVFDFENRPIDEDTTVYARWVGQQEFSFIKTDHRLYEEEGVPTRLPDAEFRLERYEPSNVCYEFEEDEDGEETCSLYEEGEWIHIMVATSQEAPNLGQVDILLLPGSRYRLTETEAPGGFSLPVGHWYIEVGMGHRDGRIDQVQFSRSLDEDEEEREDVPFVLGEDEWLVGNMPAGDRLSFIKTEDDGLTPLPDAVFHLYERDDAGTGWNPIPIEVQPSQMITGLVSFSTLLFDGEYRLREELAPSGFATPPANSYWLIVVENATITSITRDGHAPDFEDGGDLEYNPDGLELLRNERATTPVTGLGDSGNLLIGALLLMTGLAIAILGYRTYKRMNVI